MSKKNDNIKSEFLNGLGIKNKGDLKDKKILSEAASKLTNMKAEEIAAALKQVPDLAKTLVVVLNESGYIAKEISEVRKTRLKVLEKAIESGKLSGEQILELTKIITNADEKDGDVIKQIVEFLRKAGIALVAILAMVVSAYLGVKMSSDDNKK